MSASASSSEDEGDAHESASSSSQLPSKVVVTVGTYDGVLAGWELQQQNKKLEISFATPVHGGSVRSLCLASSHNSNIPGSLLSTGYDEMLKTHDWKKRLTSSGEVRTPTDFGTPVCASFAPPHSEPSTHCLVGFSGGKLVIYKKRDWSVQHVLAGHVGGVASLAVHPSGKLALSGGTSDGKLKLWDLTKGRLSYVTKIIPSTTTGRTRAASLDPVVSLVWSQDGSMYAYCHGAHISVRDVATGGDCCDVELPSRVNQVALLQGTEGTFVAAACNDGSLPVLAVETGGDQDPQEPETRRAIMAIEPVDSLVAGEERYKCIQTLSGYYVVTANSAGVVSIMNLEGAIRMIMSDDDNNQEGTANPAGSDDESDEDDEDDQQSGEEELAVDIIDAVQLGSGARITCLVAWACDAEDDDGEEENDEAVDKEATPGKASSSKQATAASNEKKRKFGGRRQDWEMDPAEVEKARALVAKAKKMQKRKESKKRKLSPGE
jgi:protein MAK11